MDVGKALIKIVHSSLNSSDAKVIVCIRLKKVMKATHIGPPRKGGSVSHGREFCPGGVVAEVSWWTSQKVFDLLKNSGQFPGCSSSENNPGHWNQKLGGHDLLKWWVANVGVTGTACAAVPVGGRGNGKRPLLA
jgi:hypothetical protein